jgi:hypothetical protein
MMKTPAGFVPSFPKLIERPQEAEPKAVADAVSYTVVWPEHYYSEWLSLNPWWRPLIKR